ncbi:hypothetical protein HDU97_006088 [Phlyctochytrium planicorne]|nr:hypothetical protein HDU97_006088 [Phlyctochytrium planicorne]
MKFLRALSLLVATVAVSRAVSIRSTKGIAIPTAGPDSVPGVYLIELEDVYDCESHVRGFLQSEHNVTNDDITTRQVITTNLFHGISIHLSEQGNNDDDLIASIPGVVSISRVNLIQAHRPVDRQQEAVNDGSSFLSSKAWFDREQVIKVFKSFRINIPETLQLKTGVYFNYSSVSFLSESATCLNLTKEFAFIAPVGVTNSRLAKVEIIFKGNFQEAAAWKSKGLNPNLPYTPYASRQASFDGFSTLNQPQVLQFAPFVRNSYVSASAAGMYLPTFYLWSGSVVLDGLVVRVPKGSYQMRFAAQHHFIKLEPSVNSVNYDVITTPVFSIVY